jgi:hypothetical protein
MNFVVFLPYSGESQICFFLRSLLPNPRKNGGFSRAQTKQKFSNEDVREIHGRRKAFDVISFNSKLF